MDTNIFIALLNPSIAALLGSAFLILWLNQRARAYMAVLAASYFAVAGGFLLQYFELPVGFLETKFLSIVCFLGAGFLMGCGISMRYGRKVPLAALVVACGSGLAAFLWFMYGQPNLTWRILSVNFALGAVSLIIFAELLAVQLKSPVDRLLMWAAMLTALNFVVRTLVIIWLQGGYDSYDGLYTSLYWTTALLTHAFLSLMVALCLLTASAIDMLRDLRAQSHTDALSGLLNRRGFEEQAGAMLDRCAKAGMPASLVIADLDHFKSINDLFGHAAGDRVIADFGGRLATAAGLRGVAGRLGGEEFAVLLPLADLASARLFAEAVRSIFSAGGIDGLPDSARVTASFGVASRTGDEELTPLLARADAALYQAKRNGRDSVRVSYERVDTTPAPAVSRSRSVG